MASSPPPLPSQPDIPTVVIVGRPNVGKSFLFNRLCQRRRALTSALAGTTRDWMESLVGWGGRSFRLIDTGGYGKGEEDVPASVRRQVTHWAKTSDLVLWVVDGPEGLTPADQDILRRLRPLRPKTLVVVNKIDSASHEALVPEFYRTGFPEVIGVSASHGRRINVLLDKIESLLPVPHPSSLTPHPLKEIRVALLGRPNVGKSSLLNALVGGERMIVSEKPGTTRDAVDTLFERDGRRYLFVDTAGLRAKKSRAGDLEALTRLMSERALERCNVALLLLDAAEGWLDGDTAAGRLIEAHRRACVVGVNKWDLVKEKNAASRWFQAQLAGRMPFLSHAPLLFLSAKTGRNVPETLSTLHDVWTRFHTEFDRDEVEAFLWSEVQKRPYSHRGRKLRFAGAEPLATAPPTLKLSSNMAPCDIHFSYRRHLENELRRRFPLSGSPLILKFQKR